MKNRNYFFLKIINIKFRLKRKFIYFSILLVGVVYVIFSLIPHYQDLNDFNFRQQLFQELNHKINKDEILYHGINLNDSFIITSSEINITNKINNDNNNLKLNHYDYVFDLLFNNTINNNSANKEKIDIDRRIIELILSIIQKPLNPNDFIDLEKREKLHTLIWRSLFQSRNSIYDKDSSKDSIGLMTYKEKLMRESSFLSQGTTDNLQEIEKLLAKLHQSLYPWLYGYRYHSFSDIIKSSNGRGIVICTSDKYFKLVRSHIDILRHILNSTLPIEIIYNGENDLSVKHREILVEEFDDVYLTDISTYFNSTLIGISGWAIKPFAILASRFDEVILMDADALYIRDPMELFNDKNYQEKGTLFFKDRTIFSGPHEGLVWLKEWMTDPLPETKELRFWNEKTCHEMESSTVVLHKTRTILGLLNVCKLNELDFRRIVYQKVYGDKETFWMGFDMARQSYYMNSIPSIFIGEISHSHSLNGISLCGHTGHMIEKGKILFWNGHLIKNKNLEELNENHLIQFEAYYMDNDNEGEQWSGNLECLLLKDDEKPTYLSEEEQIIIKEIIEREKNLHYVITPSKKKILKSKYKTIINRNQL